MDAVVGCSVGTGWVVLVSATPEVNGADPGVAVLDRRRAVLVAGDERFAYHRAAGLDLAEAAAVVAAVREGARATAAAVVDEVVAQLASAGARLAGAAIVGPRATPVPPLADIVASHAAIHTAEGALYRSAMADAFAGLPVEVSVVHRRDLAAQVRVATGAEAAAVEGVLADLGRRLGPPWRKEQKEATLAAWSRLAAAGPGAGSRHTGRA